MDFKECNQCQNTFPLTREFFFVHLKGFLPKCKSCYYLLYLPNKTRGHHRLPKGQRKTRQEINSQSYARIKSNPNLYLKSLFRSRIKEALKNNSKSAKTLDLLGCPIETAKKYIESKFQVGMGWDNHGFYGWHIDHIKPCSSFDLSNPDEQKKCFNYTNLQPLWAKDNLSKGSKYGRE
jgi:hypothetical protein